MVALCDPFSFGEEEIEDTLEIARKKESPRILKTHLSFEMMPEQIMQKKNKVCNVVN